MPTAERLLIIVAILTSFMCLMYAADRLVEAADAYSRAGAHTARARYQNTIDMLEYKKNGLQRLQRHPSIQR